MTYYVTVKSLNRTLVRLFFHNNYADVLRELSGWIGEFDDQPIIEITIGNAS